MLINTILAERTIEREGLWERLSAEDLPALTPLLHGQINPYGQFSLDLNRPMIRIRVISALGSVSFDVSGAQVSDVLQKEPRKVGSFVVQIAAK